MGYISTWMGDCLSSGPAIGCVWVGISLCYQTFVNSRALLVSLMALHSHWGTDTPFALVFSHENAAAFIVNVHTYNFMMPCVTNHS